MTTTKLNERQKRYVTLAHTNPPARKMTRKELHDFDRDLAAQIADAARALTDDELAVAMEAL